MSWHSLVGVPGYATGTAGTIQVPAGAIIHLITVHSTSGGSFTILGGPAIAVIANAAPLVYQFQHTLFQANVSNGGTLVFTNTDHYFVHWIRQGNV